MAHIIREAATLISFRRERHLYAVSLVPLRLHEPPALTMLRALWDFEWGTFKFGERIYGKTSIEAADELESLLEGAPLRDSRALDAGCGLGRAAIELRTRYGLRLIASDISRTALREARQASLDVLQADLMRLPLRSDSLDLAWSHGVLHYLPDPALAVKELARVTRPGGWIAFTIWPPLPRWLRWSASVARALVRPLPIRAIRILALVLAPLHGIVHRLSRLRAHPVELAEGAHIVFNMLTAPHLQYADRETVGAWCRAAGCHEIRYRSPEVRVLARKFGQPPWQGTRDSPTS